MRKAPGFTLVEMLVVIGILGVLAAMLFPVLSKARESGRTATCVAQLSQICKAARMYSGDCDRTIVPARTSVRSTGTRGITWCVLLQPYLENKQILVCPSDEGPSETDRSVCLPHSYGINYLLSYNSTWGARPFVASMSFVQRPSEIIQFFEIKSSTKSMGTSYYSHRLSRIDARHNELGNFAYLDGHIKGLKANAVNDQRVWDPFSN